MFYKAKIFACKYRPRKQKQFSNHTKTLFPCLPYSLALDMFNFALPLEVFSFWHYHYNSEEANYINS